MSKPSKLSLSLVILFSIISIALYICYGKVYNATPINSNASNKYWLTVILLPLDSRPPCTQFVERLAHIAGIKLLMPQPELLDDYKTPANKEALRIWLRQTSKQADAAIISTDMLIHGSLVASRLSSGTVNDTNDVLKLLTTVHQENPNFKMYVFSIIPRLLIADSQENAIYQKNMLKYSILKDQIYTFENIEDIKKLTALEEQIPVHIMNHYTAMYEQNTKLNGALMDMVEQGILSSLIIGQDDGQPFGMPNINKQKLQHQLLQKPVLANKVFITRGTDEVALTLLSHIVTSLSNYQPHIFVVYSTNEGAQITMPYMPNTVATTVEEKIRIAGGLQVDNAEQADFILYIHVGSKKNKSIYKPAAEQLKTLLNQGYKVALVDLTENFQLDETLLPVLLAQNVDLPKLIAYAGWNTTSNSIGTAITQACIFSNALTTQADTPGLVGLYQDNLEFLTARFLDDLYYQKEVNPYINKQLQRVHIDPYNLGSHYYQTNYKIQKLMFSKARWLLSEALYNRPVIIETNQGPQKIIITDLNIKTNLPWQRTFEIWLKPKLSLAFINE
ncbi:MAG: hypothetical protein H6Q68_371 [Firmicutes bacterium]|nr:hypothetical protein [Bacillota bacterium]